MLQELSEAKEQLMQVTGASSIETRQRTCKWQKGGHAFAAQRGCELRNLWELRLHHTVSIIRNMARYDFALLFD